MAHEDPAPTAAHGADQATQRDTVTILVALALACLLAAGAALLVTTAGWLFSACRGRSDGEIGEVERDWPGIGWLVCLPSLAAAFAFSVARKKATGES
jgi:hypothetical protein